jgi:hypothetical protein
MFSLTAPWSTHRPTPVSSHKDGGIVHQFWHGLQPLVEMLFDAQRPDPFLPLVAEGVLSVAGTYLLSPHTAEQVEQFIAKLDPKKYPCRPSFQLYHIGSVMNFLVAEGLISKQGGGNDATYLRSSDVSLGLRKSH